MPHRKILDFSASEIISGVFLGILGVKLQKLDTLLLNLLVGFEARRITGMTPLRATEAAKGFFPKCQLSKCQLSECQLTTSQNVNSQNVNS